MQPMKILVVEDNLASLELMSEVFSSLKADVRPISDSEKAAIVVNQERFDGIFLDLKMPKLNGFDLARLIRKSSWNKSTPIVRRETNHARFVRARSDLFSSKTGGQTEAECPVPHGDRRDSGEPKEKFPCSYSG